MTVDVAKLRERIAAHCYSEWEVVTEGQHTGPVVKDVYGNEILSIDVGHAVWTCDDEQDGCPEVARDAVALAKLLCDLPGYAMELIQTVERLQRTVQDLERDLEEADRGF
jgi:hypothetical protein